MRNDRPNAEVIFRHREQVSVIPVTETSSVMEVARRNGVPGIVAECGGQLMCATCHVYVVQTAPNEILPASEDESAMLELAASPVTDRSRLSCQITVEPGDGMTIEVQIPERQI